MLDDAGVGLFPQKSGGLAVHFQLSYERLWSVSREPRQDAQDRRNMLARTHRAVAWLSNGSRVKRLGLE